MAAPKLHPSMINDSLRTGSRDSSTVEEARRTMLSAGYVLPPNCQPVPVEHPPQPPPVMEPTFLSVPERRRHSISVSPVAGVVGAASSPSDTTGHKRRYSLPGGRLGTGVPLTAFLPVEYKRRRTDTATPEQVDNIPPCQAMLPSISNLVNGPVAVTSAERTYPEPCLPPHTAATPDHPHFGLPDQRPVATVGLIPLLRPSAVALAPRAVCTASQLMYSASSGSPSPSSSAPSSPSLPDISASVDRPKREETEAAKEGRAQRVAEILDLMDRQNSAADGGVDGLLDAKRRRVGKDQTGVLDLVFKVEPMPSQAIKKRLADGLGMTYKQVQIWFQNKRARCKRAVEAPPRSSHTFHNMLVSSDGRLMVRGLAKAQPQPLQHHHHHEHIHQPTTAALPLSLRPCILTR